MTKRKRVDDIIELIDGGLQESSEPGYGDDTYPDRCVRCRRSAKPDDGGDICAGCRSFLLGDTDFDPIHYTLKPLGHSVVGVSRWSVLNAGGECLIEGVAPITIGEATLVIDGLTDAFRSLMVPVGYAADAMAEFIGAFRELLETIDLEEVLSPYTVRWDGHEYVIEVDEGDEVESDS